MTAQTVVASRRRWALRSERGMATAEFAAAMPAFVLMLCIGIGSVGAVAAQLRCEHSSYLVAREAARGDGTSATRDLPGDARLEIVRRDGRVYATVRATVKILGARMPGISVSATSAAAVEHGVLDQAATP